MRYLAIAAVLLLSGCAATTPYYGRGNSNIDYRGTSFATVNSCTHTTAMPCGFGG